MNVKTPRKESIVRSLLRPLNTTFIIFVGIYTVVWGAWVANPFWVVFTKAELYGFLAVVAPEVFWGSLALVCGISSVMGAYRRSYRSLKNASAILIWHWFMIATFYAIGDLGSTGGITSAFFSIFSAYVWLNMKVNKAHHERIFDDD